MDRIAKLEKEARERKASEYKLLFQRLGIDKNSLKTFEITKELSSYGIEMNARQWRKIVEDVMYLFIYGEVDFLIVGDTNGYKATSDETDLNNFLKKKHNQFLALATNYNRLKHMCETRKNMAIEF
jgi:hypothetical protein